MQTLDPLEHSILTNYAAGINKVVEELKIYPFEFQLLWTSFEPWTVRDSVACQTVGNALVSVDWFAEMLRVRLLEVYDRDLVDQIIPFKPEHFYEFGDGMHTVRGDAAGSETDE